MAKLLKGRPRRAKSQCIPKVFAMHKDDILEPRHVVIWAKSGNLSGAEQRGNVKRFRVWGMAKTFAGRKAKQIGATKSKRIDSDHASYHG